VPPDDVVGDVAVVAAGPARPGGPQRTGGEDPPGQRRQPVGELDLGPEERDDQVRGAVGSRNQQAVRRFPQLPAGRRLVERDPLPGLEAQLARLRCPGV